MKISVGESEFDKEFNKWLNEYFPNAGIMQGISLHAAYSAGYELRNKDKNLDRVYDEIIVRCEIPNRDIKTTFFPHDKTSIRKAVSLMKDEREYITKIKCLDIVPEETIKELKESIDDKN